MNHLLISFLAAITVIFHISVRSPIKKGKVREALCAGWCTDAVFAVCGTIISFNLYQYEFVPFLTIHNLLWGLIFAVITFLFFLLAPSGLSLFTQKKEKDAAALLLAEYRFDDTLCMVRNFFLALLFILPVFLTVLGESTLQTSLFLTWSTSEICGAFCFTAFLILLPISLRQLFFWLKHLTSIPAAEEMHILHQYRIRLHYRSRNHRL